MGDSRCLRGAAFLLSALAAALIVEQQSHAQVGEVFGDPGLYTEDDVYTEVEGEGIYRTEIGDYTIHYSAVRSDALPAVTAAKHGLPDNANAALINVTVQRDGENIRSRIDVSATNLAEQTREVMMLETVANGLVSYTGAVEIADREVLDFRIELLPRGAPQPIELAFRQDFLPRPEPDPLR